MGALVQRGRHSEGDQRSVETVSEMEDVPLEVLHDHHKDSFSYIREREKQRDRLFLILIGLFALLSVEILYPAQFGGALGALQVTGAEVDLGALPLPALLSASWVFIFAIALRYCQVSINVERQYSYLHRLEEKMSQLVGDPDLYRRESKAYLEDYPLFSDWAWICYVFVFPVIAALATMALIIAEWSRPQEPWPYDLFNSLLAAAIVLSFFLYRIVPSLPWKPAGRRDDSNTK